MSAWAGVSVDLPHRVTAATCRCSWVSCTVWSSRFVCLCHLVEWAWWPSRTDRLEIWCFISRLTWAKSVFSDNFKIESRILDSVCWRYLSWKWKKSFEATITSTCHSMRMHYVACCKQSTWRDLILKKKCNKIKVTFNAKLCVRTHVTH